ncbi:MAG: 4-alpha-glucanotransferase [Candidatus Competibacteraceae bacterium]|uniref:4-alpha-glucanotransferase n=1 Tax=Candidatus Contendobacter odensis Run_B_J11 TaxID=1400861 RepID=A0A7U7GFY8_9GAMM|nr:4-alpha-glucanotransferase [Candidatus Contendobacter odensis]MBK8537262.1 4-alpha-glucanotransferase [Candidatus Competibacteraceae bacterium]MBK8754273.1 4-alpha-glucanotransferase [Candidatus Competibacteraceae bacterium]CDH47161.1 4-alpha-glucanotransferase [Candidatus Contendobacter odensis Run_B_J11]
MTIGSPFDRRRAGLLLHPTSLPGGYGNGDLGSDAYRFVEFLAACGFTVWQTLPLGPTHDDLSPYSAQSVHAGNPRLIALEPLVDAGWLRADGGPGAGEDGWAYRRRRLGEARQGFQGRGGKDFAAFEAFRHQHRHWLDDYALYQAIRAANGQRAWFVWPNEQRDRQPKALTSMRQQCVEAITQCQFEQFLFDRQWMALKRYANERGILMFGDIPLFVGYDSADVWAQRDMFLLDRDGRREVVAGVPPDYFSATGQLWGNPHYAWERMEADGFQWWKERIRTQLTQFDLLRIDHFRGLEAYWEIPASAETAVAGRWQLAPGDALFKALKTEFGALPLVAEDLGIITPEVETLRDAHHLPGMKVLHFAFGGGADNPYLPHNHLDSSVIYTGTHDNNTTLGWFHELDESTRAHVFDYLGGGPKQMPELLVRAAFASVARLAVTPMQDVLALGGEHRMNRPGVADGCWRWRFRWDQVGHEVAGHYRHLLELYGRV